MQLDRRERPVPLERMELLAAVVALVGYGLPNTMAAKGNN
jgi:hypothetical protein